jgi:hypothetical protein
LVPSQRCFHASLSAMTTKSQSRTIF